MPPNRSLTRLRAHLGLLVVLAIFLSVAVAYGLVYPLGESPDELAHMARISFVAQEGHLPRDESERLQAGYKSDKPMLYAMLMGAATRWVDYSALPALKKVNEDNPRRLLIEDDLTPYVVTHTDDEAFPYQGIVLAWHVVRLLSAVCSVGTLVVVYLIVLSLWPGDRWRALSATALVAAIPQFQWVSSVVIDDNLLGFLSALCTLLLVRMWRRPDRLWSYAWLGLAMGLALMTKYSVALFPLLVVPVIVKGLRHGILNRKAALRRGALFVAALAAASAWWFVYVEWYFNEIARLGLWPGLVKPLLADGIDASMQRVASMITSGSIAAAPGGGAPALTRWWAWLVDLFQSSWLLAGRMNLPASGAFYAGCLLVSVVAVAGLVYAWVRRSKLPWGSLGLLALQVALLVPAPALRFFLTGGRPTETGQGRHILFPAAAAAGLFLSMGVTAWVGEKWQRLVSLGLAGILFAASIGTFWGAILPGFPARLPVRTAAEAVRDVPNPMNLRLVEDMALIGYQVGPVNAGGGLPVTLFWRGEKTADQDYRLELALLDANGTARSRWLGEPVDGHYPTRAWDPGDVVRDTIWLPVPGLPGGDYRLVLSLWGSDGSQLPGATDVPLTAVTLATTAARSGPPTRRVHLSGGELAFDVWQAGQPAAGMPVYRYRAAIPITMDGPQAASAVLVGPDGVEQPPQARAGEVALFLVGPRWPAGAYRLRVRDAGATADSEPVLRVKTRLRVFDVPAMANVVQANFAGEVMLLGYDLRERRLEPGGDLPVTLYWQALHPLARQYMVANRVLNTADLGQWGARDQMPYGYYSTMLWAPGEVVPDYHTIRVAPEAPDGVYRLDVGLYTVVAGQAVHLPLVADGKPLVANMVTIAPIKVGGPPPGVTVPAPAPEHPRADNLNDQVTLIGYDLSRQPDRIVLALYWRCDARLAVDYTTFVHVRHASPPAGGETGQPVAQMDRPPADGAYPTSVWDAGEVIRDVVQVPVPAQLPAGEYEIAVGLYDSMSGSRLAVRGSPDGSITLTGLTWPR